VTLAISPAHGDLLAALSRAKPRRRVVVIGAVALNHHVPLERSTADVDFVIVAEAEDIAVLLRSVHWEPDLQQEHRWRDRQRNAVDVLPANAEVIAAGKDDWDDRRWQVPLADLEHEVQAAFFVGQQVRGIVGASHRVEVENFLLRVATDTWLDILGAGGLVCTDPELVAQRRLAAFRDGLG
jgi:hypothetical protein